MNITKDVVYVGVNDRKIDLFEGQYQVPNGMAYNSYVIIDEKIAVMDSVDLSFGEEWICNIKSVLGERQPDYLIVQHMEPDHSANIVRFTKSFPEAKIVSSAKSFAMMKNFFGEGFGEKEIAVSEGSSLSLGKHNLKFTAAPMVHWPEVIVTYDSVDKILFSADGFGKFGAYDADEEWADEARRYYIGIVGKYGAQVQNLLKKAAALDIEIICPLHGPVLKENVNYYVDLYDKWSSYTPEEDGVVIAYASVYGNTERAAKMLAEELQGKTKVALYNLTRCDMAAAVADAFKYSKLVLASVTYNAELFPAMREFILNLKERNFSNREVGIIENGSWAPMAAKLIRAMLESSKNISFKENTVKILSAIKEENKNEIKALANELINKTTLQGELIMSVKFYVCEKCGNIVEKIQDSGVSLVCCGQKMTELRAGVVEASREKHIPVVTVKDGAVEVVVGSVIHPMAEEHNISWVYLETDRGGQRKNFKPGDEPRASFALSGEKPIAVYAYCNLHGLWKYEI